MRAALLIGAKDLRQRLRDRSAIVVALVAPLVLAVVFGLALGGTGDGSTRFDVAVVDEDGGSVARAFTGTLLPRVEKAGVIAVRRARSAEEGRRLASGGDVVATYVLPSGLSRAVSTGRPAELAVVGDVDRPIGTLVARSIAESFAGELSSLRVAVAAAIAAGSDAKPAELAARARAVPQPVRIVDVSAERKRLELKTFFAAGISVFFLFFTVQFGLSSVLDERRDGTLGRLLAAPIPRASILGGKVLTSLVLGVASMAALAVATSLVLGADWGSPLGAGLLIVSGVVAATCWMALVVTFARTPEQAGYWQSIVALVLGLVGGSFFPVYQAGGAAEALSNLTPHAWFLRGLGDLSAGEGIGAILPSVGWILLMAAITGGLALLRLGRLLRP